MHSFVTKHRFVVFVLASSLLLCPALMAETARPEQVQTVADTFLDMRIARSDTVPRLFSVTEEAETAPAGFQMIRDDDGTILAYIAHLEPHGFIAISADTDITPIVAYSLNNSFPSVDDEKNPLYRLLKEDMKLRLQRLASPGSTYTKKNNNQWNLYGGGRTEKPTREVFQQWPAEQTTSTGGWLETTWHQSQPYNALCPLDPVDSNRCVVGCVATAMAQIINYHQSCSARFDASDMYSTYNGIDIDADRTRYDFPSLEDLNQYLNTLSLKYNRGVELDDRDRAALSFACGIAALMDYSSEGSGAILWDSEQAIIDTFDFHSAELTGGLSNEFLATLRENLVNGLPAIIGLTYPTYGAGHAIVCDGYNTDGEYHLNFGWGSDAPDEITEAWYHLPVEIAEAFVDETILNIRRFPPALEVNPGSILFRTVPGVESESVTVFIKNNTTEPLPIHSILSPEGFVISLPDGDDSDHIESFTIRRPEEEVAINVKFRPVQTGSFHGNLTINYGFDKSKYILLTGSAVEGGTLIEAGEVSGTWSGARSPYYVLGDIRVARDSELRIEPGVRVLFMGPYSLTVSANTRLVAEGTANEPIELTAADRELGWKGLRFLRSSNDDILSYCSITFSKKGSESTTVSTRDSHGGAIYCDTSTPTITHCRITNNIGDSGGAVYCYDSDLVMCNSLIANNTSMGSYPQAGGICCLGESSLQIENCTIVNNFPGGILSETSYPTTLTNTILWGNGICQIECSDSMSEITFCDVQAGYPGEGNIDMDPCFFDPSLGIGADFDGSAANWALGSASPCINGGIEMGLPEFDLAGNTRIYSDLVDIGAYENQSELPLITLTPASIVDMGSTEIGDESTTILDISNTGKVDFKIEDLSLSDSNSTFSITTPVADHTLAPGEWIPVAIGFAPTVEKIYSDILHIRSTSSNGADRTVELRGAGVSGTIIPPGEVSGTWTKANNPYTVTGDIEVQKGRTLTIEPGVVVKFTGHYSLRVGARSTLRAVGTESESITFTVVDVNEGWCGIRFIDAGNDDILRYCTIEYANEAYIGQEYWQDGIGGGVLCAMSYSVTSLPSSPTIDHCVIARNYSPYGGGITCMDESEATITNNTIVDNSGSIGGGIWVFYANPLIANNVIAHNSAGAFGGGIYNYFGIPTILNNTIAHNRPNGLDLDWVTDWYVEQGAPIWNNIIWENEIYVWDDVLSNEYDVRFNNIQGGSKGEEVEGNIDVDPCFADSRNRDYHLKSEAGRWDPASGCWIADSVTSPCIDAGNPETEIGEESAPNGSRVNMGAYGGTVQASRSSQ